MLESTVSIALRWVNSLLKSSGVTEGDVCGELKLAIVIDCGDFEYCENLLFEVLRTFYSIFYSSDFNNI